MKIVSSYPVRLMESRSLFDPTIKIYREAVAFLVDITNKEWDTLGPEYKRYKLKSRQRLEYLVHKTRDNPAPKYDFDSKFYKFPSYFRRAAMTMALGAVSSYRSNLKNWEDSGKAGNPPKLTYARDVMPTFFKDNMSDSREMLAGLKDEAQLKLYINNDWVFRPIKCPASGRQVLGEVVELREPLRPDAGNPTSDGRQERLPTALRL